MEKIKELFDYINKQFEGQVPNLIFFAIGIAIGIIFFLFTSLIIYLIYKTKSKKDKKKIKEIQVNETYKTIIESNKQLYKDVYIKLPLQDKLKGIGKLMLNMMEQISILYYPNSNDPIFEISIEQIVDFLKYFQIRLESFVDNLLKNRLHMVNFITKYSIKDKKISFIIDLISKNKQESKKETTNWWQRLIKRASRISKKAAIKIGSNMIDKEFLDMIDSLGEDINNLYCKRPLKYKNNYRRRKAERKGDENV